LLSLDDQTAFVNFKKLSVAEKLQVWNKHVDASSTNAHSIGFYNVNSNNHVKYIADADYCERYVHKCHFYELDGPTDFYKVDGLQDKKQISFLNNVTGSKKSIGIYLTDNCIDQLEQIRTHIPPSNCYQTWVYRNQARLLKEFYNINSVHTFSFTDMLDVNVLIDHLKYCQDRLDLSISVDKSREVVLQWYQLLNYKPR
jgi:hypothetical protein